MKTLSIILCAFCIALSGCMSVPATTIKYDPSSKQLDLGSPKDVTINKASVVESNGFFSLTLEGYSAKNNLEVIKAVVEGNAKARQSIEENGAAIIGKVIGEMK